MSKSNVSRSVARPHTGAVRRRKPGGMRWLPYAVAGALIVLGAVVWGIWLAASPDGDQGVGEHFSGISGVSYDGGPTEFAYPDPAGLGEGRQWLPSLGDAEAPVVVIEFSDIFCGHCRRYNLDTLPAILEDYVAKGQVRYVDHYFGFPQTVQQGVVMAQFCAAEQGRYFEFKHALFLSVEVNALDLDRAARIAGVDMDTFLACQANATYMPALQDAVFVNNMGVNSTPTFFINGEMIAGNLPDEIRGMIDAALADE